MKSIYLFLTLCIITIVIKGDESTHTYTSEESVIVWVNKVGPFNNPHQFYSYYTLPFCTPNTINDRPENLGESIEGNSLQSSVYELYFTSNLPRTDICSVKMTSDNFAAFDEAIKEKYWYQMYIDDLPLWGLVGRIRDSTEDSKSGSNMDNEAEPKDVHNSLKTPGTNSLSQDSTSNLPHIFTHQHFSIGYNGFQIVDVNLTSDYLTPLEPGVDITFTYSVEWKKSNIEFEDRFKKYLEYDFFEHSIHWFSIFNSFMMVIFLAGIVSVILLRTLRADYAKYTRLEEDDSEGMNEITSDGGEKDIGDESGWKQVRADVFRAPNFLGILSVLVGTGAQLLGTIFLVIFYAILRGVWPGRGVLLNVSLFSYAFAGVLGGFVSGFFYKHNNGGSWQAVLLVQWAGFPTFVFGLVFTMNWVAVFYGALTAIPFGSMVEVVLIWIVIGLTFVVAGTIAGRAWQGGPKAPYLASNYPRPIPDKPWYLSLPIISLIGGILPFGSIFIEMYFIFTSFFSFKYYYVYGFMLLVTIILIIVTICVTIVAIYFLLNAEDYRWHWTSFGTAASTSAYVFLYSIYFFFFKTRMSGFLQTVYYFGNVLTFCVALSIICGTIGLAGSFLFVYRIYRDIKMD